MVIQQVLKKLSLQQGGTLCQKCPSMVTQLDKKYPKPLQGERATIHMQLLNNLKHVDENKTIILSETSLS